MDLVYEINLGEQVLAVNKLVSLAANDFSEDFAMMLSIISRDERSDNVKASGMVLEGNEYKIITNCTVESQWDKHGYQTGMECWAITTEGTEYNVSGEVISLIPLRNRRKSPDGTELQTESLKP